MPLRAFRTLGPLGALGALRPLVALEPLRPVVPVKARVAEIGAMMLLVLQLSVVTVVPEIAVMAHELAELQAVRLGDLAPAHAARALGEDPGEHHLLARAVGDRAAVQRRLDLLRRRPADSMLGERCLSKRERDVHVAEAHLVGLGRKGSRALGGRGELHFLVIAKAVHQRLGVRLRAGEAREFVDQALIGLAGVSFMGRRDQRQREKKCREHRGALGVQHTRSLRVLLTGRYRCGRSGFSGRIGRSMRSTRSGFSARSGLSTRACCMRSVGSRRFCALLISPRLKPSEWAISPQPSPAARRSSTPASALLSCSGVAWVMPCFSSDACVSASALSTLPKPIFWVGGSIVVTVLPLVSLMTLPSRRPLTSAVEFWVEPASSE